MTNYTADQVTQRANLMRTTGFLDIAYMLDAFAALLREHEHVKEATPNAIDALIRAARAVAETLTEEPYPGSAFYQLDAALALIDAVPEPPAVSADKIVPPRRALVLKATIEADTLADLASHLLNLATQVEMGELGQSSISGGYSSGHVIDFSWHNGPTHGEYEDQLAAYLRRKAESKPEPPAVSDEPPKGGA